KGNRWKPEMKAEFRREQEIPWEKYKTQLADIEAESGVLRDSLSKTIYPTPIDTSAREITPGDLATLWDVTPDSLHQGLFDLRFGTVLPKDVFIEHTINRAIRVSRAKDLSHTSFGYTRERIGQVYDKMLMSLRIDPTTVPELAPRLMELEGMRQATLQMSRVKNIPTETLREVRAYIDDIGRQLGDVPGYYKPTTRELSDEMANAQKLAMNDAKKDYALTFADYDPNGIMAVDDFARSIMPYWPYEIHRPLWLARNFIQHPVVPLTLGRYNNNTDRGYVHIPGTSIEVNPFRGTIFGPVLTRLTMRDFPEYFDTWSGFSQYLDYAGRAGFYPGIQFQLPLTMFGAKGNVRPQFGLLMPAWMKTSLNAALATLPSDATEVLRDILFPDYFR
ncbi:hypothetical protein LCGC14_2882100, partial [marine sediment metagenome]